MMLLFYILGVCIITEYIGSIIHELGHCLTYILLTRKLCYCYIKYPWFLPETDLTKCYGIYKLRIIFSSTLGPRSQFNSINNRLINLVTILMGPLIENIFYIVMISLTGIKLIGILCIISCISNFHPYIVNCDNKTDGLRIINLIYPDYPGLQDPFGFITLMVMSYLIYLIL